jgi:hypothetical protein
MTDTAAVLDFTPSTEPTLLDILNRDLSRAIDRQSFAEGKVNTAKLHMEQAQAEYENGMALLAKAADEVQHLKRTVHVHELAALKPKAV